MIFKRTGSKIFGVELTAKEKSVINKYIEEEVKRACTEMEMDNDSAMLWILYEHFDFTPEQLRKMWELIADEFQNIIHHYEVDASDGGFICRQKLKDHCGIDLKQWYSE